jgi:hypothetical protein
VDSRGTIYPAALRNTRECLNGSCCESFEPPTGPGPAWKRLYCSETCRNANNAGPPIVRAAAPQPSLVWSSSAPAAEKPAVSCTGLTAQWCPQHGDCACPDRTQAMDDPACPLHAPTSDHPHEPVVMQVAQESLQRPVQTPRPRLRVVRVERCLKCRTRHEVYGIAEKADLPEPGEAADG